MHRPLEPSRVLIHKKRDERATKKLIQQVLCQEILKSAETVWIERDLSCLGLSKCLILSSVESRKVGRVKRIWVQGEGQQFAESGIKGLGGRKKFRVTPLNAKRKGTSNIQEFVSL